MKKLIIVSLLILLAACTHTQEENYSMINKIVGELAILNDSLTYLDATITAAIPESKNKMVDGKNSRIYEEKYVKDLCKTKDSLSGNMMMRYNVLHERYGGYKEIFGIIYKELPKDSAAVNKRIKEAYTQAARY